MGVAPRGLDRGDLLSGAGALAQQFQQLLVQTVDTAAQRRQGVVAVVR